MPNENTLAPVKGAYAQQQERIRKALERSVTKVNVEQDGESSALVETKEPESMSFVQHKNTAKKSEVKEENALV